MKKWRLTVEVEVSDDMKAGKVEVLVSSIARILRESGYEARAVSADEVEEG